jgi:hypothetical protein
MNKKCSICGQEFVTKRTAQITCSPACSYENEKRKNLERANNSYRNDPAVRERHKARKQTEEYKKKARTYMKKRRADGLADSSYKQTPEYKKKQAEYQKKQRELGKDYVSKHPRKTKAYARKYYKDNKKRHLEQSREYSRKHPEYAKKSKAMRRSRELGISVKMPSAEIVSKRMNHFGGCCYCDRIEDLTLEHLKPISKGGTHREGNLYGACKACNSSKQDQNWMSWYRKQRFYKPEREIEIRRLSLTVIKCNKQVGLAD